MTVNMTFKPLRSLLPVLCALVLLARSGAAQGADADAYGGSTRVRWEATGWFRLQQNGGRVSFLNLVPTSRFLRDKASFPDVFDAAFQRDLQTRIERQWPRRAREPALARLHVDGHAAVELEGREAHDDHQFSFATPGFPRTM